MCTQEGPRTPQLICQVSWHKKDLFLSFIVWILINVGNIREMNIYKFKHILQCLFRLPREMSTWQFEKIISKYLSRINIQNLLLRDLMKFVNRYLIPVHKKHT